MRLEVFNWYKIHTHAVTQQKYDCIPGIFFIPWTAKAMKYLWAEKNYTIFFSLVLFHTCLKVITLSIEEKSMAWKKDKYHLLTFLFPPPSFLKYRHIDICPMTRSIRKQLLPLWCFAVYINDWLTDQMQQHLSFFSFSLSDFSRANKNTKKWQEANNI